MMFRLATSDVIWMMDAPQCAESGTGSEFGERERARERECNVENTTKKKAADKACNVETVSNREGQFSKQTN